MTQQPGKLQQTLDVIRNQHKALLLQIERPGEVDLEQVRIFLKTLAQGGETIDDAEDRSLLQELIRYWSSFINDKTGEFPIVQLQPFDSSLGRVRGTRWLRFFSKRVDSPEVRQVESPQFVQARQKFSEPLPSVRNYQSSQRLLERVGKRNRLIDSLSKVVQRNLTLSITLLIVLGIGLEIFAFSPSFSTSPPVLNLGLKGLGLGLIVTAITTFLLQVSVQSLANKVENDIGDNISNQLQRIVGSSASLLAMDAIGIPRIYLKRSEACEEIIHDIQNTKISQLDILGISLYDLLHDDNKEFRALWQIIKGYITEPMTRIHKLTIRILIIDPNCYGAHLRSKGELRGARGRRERLTNDVNLAATHFDALAQVNQTKRAEIEREYPDALLDRGVSFEFRLYRLPPSLFLIRTDTTSYIQPYYFWATSDVNASMPLFRCHDDPAYQQHSVHLHQGMKDHFDFIWDSAAITFHEFSREYQVGVDKGVHQCGIVNVFDNSNTARKRILWLLQNAKRRVYLQGITLQSFFDGRELSFAIKELVKKGNVEVKVLLLHPDSEQARYWSYREYFLNKPPLTFEAFQQDPKLHQLSAHYQNTLHTVDRIRSLQPHAKFQVRFYDSMPTSFMLLVDDNVLIEQYTYGKLDEDLPVVSPNLGEGMGLIEYTREPKDVYEQTSVRNSFYLMENHFKFVFEGSSIMTP